MPLTPQKLTLLVLSHLLTTFLDYTAHAFSSLNPIAGPALDSPRLTPSTRLSRPIGSFAVGLFQYNELGPDCRPPRSSGQKGIADQIQSASSGQICCLKRILALRLHVKRKLIPRGVRLQGSRSARSLWTASASGEIRHAPATSSASVVEFRADCRLRWTSCTPKRKIQSSMISRM
jgi:hypothetical protein